MQYQECSSNITKMYRLYGKQAPANDILKNYFDFLEDYKENELKLVIKSFIKKSKFVPTVAELVNEIEQNRLQRKFKVLDYMYKKGYFKPSSNLISDYDKAVKYLESGVIPEWFKKDYKKYYAEMKE